MQHLQHQVLSILYSVSPQSLSKRQLATRLFLAGYLHSREDLGKILEELSRTNHVECCICAGAMTCYRLMERPWEECVESILRHMRREMQP
ncbi:MAG: hypothetical protein LBC42_03945 [Puniceicoccales bacterium]|jgi:hypothetical protein|nr:hypothetical protein [Puniceicoccales bacterium]